MSRSLHLTVALGLAGCGADALDVGPGEVDPGDGKTDGATGNVELKVTVEPITTARSKLSLSDGGSEQREIWFYDTSSLELLDAGTILRARKIYDAPDDSTVKLRPAEDLAGMKCEVDASINVATPACSLTIVQDNGEIDDVGDGARDIDKLFSSEQEAVYGTYGPAIAINDLLALGPIPARVWTIRTSQLPAKLVAELWDMPDGSQVLELSMRVLEADADDGMDALLDFVDGRGLDLADEQESKTRRALESLVTAN